MSAQVGTPHMPHVFTPGDFGFCDVCGRLRVAEVHHDRRPCPHGCAGGHTEDEYYGGDCPHRVGEAFEGWGPGL